ncbi:helix-turn-helix transcriptional regulator [Anaeromyxobacter oryzae]|uniref:DNA-binding protein n=1 Tax=Anaeromyxobacter oryzae TaxID=2918170 RepID=A0ABM7WRI4_9BACT|nr:helix-turn-helix transcriptional regulator [Anaeromyxobacter oryzae]BDG02065.1 DNA-binding protein [Anaeromyxobacter oryzae]
MAEYLSTSEVARYLKLNQKKVYALIASGQLPAARISGKWLFPKELVDRWVEEHTVYPAGGLMATLLDQLVVVQGSDDWLLAKVFDRFRSRFGTPIAAAAVGSAAGISALEAGTAHVASCHLDASAVRNGTKHPVYLFGLYAREQGILFDRGRQTGIEGLRALCREGIRFARRQEQSGTFQLVERLLGAEKLEPRWTPIGPFSSHLEVALDVRNGHADAGVGIRMAAHVAGLDFVPLAREPFYLVIPASLMSHRRLGQLLEFLVEELTAEARRQPAGYSFEALGRVQPLAPRSAE